MVSTEKLISQEDISQKINRIFKDAKESKFPLYSIVHHTKKKKKSGLVMNYIQVVFDDGSPHGKSANFRYFSDDDKIEIIKNILKTSKELDSLKGEDINDSNFIENIRNKFKIDIGDDNILNSKQILQKIDELRTGIRLSLEDKVKKDINEVTEKNLSLYYTFLTNSSSGAEKVCFVFSNADTENLKRTNFSYSFYSEKGYDEILECVLKNLNEELKKQFNKYFGEALFSQDEIEIESASISAKNFSSKKIQEKVKALKIAIQEKSFKPLAEKLEIFFQEVDENFKFSSVTISERKTSLRFKRADESKYLNHTLNKNSVDEFLEGILKYFSEKNKEEFTSYYGVKLEGAIADQVEIFNKAIKNKKSIRTSDYIEKAKEINNKAKEEGYKFVSFNLEQDFSKLTIIFEGNKYQTHDRDRFSFSCESVEDVKLAISAIYNNMNDFRNQFNAKYSVCNIKNEEEIADKIFETIMQSKHNSPKRAK